MNTVTMFAIEDMPVGGFVTFGEFKGDYLIENVTIDEAALFSYEDAEAVLDYFEDTTVKLKVRAVKIPVYDDLFSIVHRRPSRV